MIPILFDRDTLPKTIINSNNLGLGMLNDCISATVTEELNGRYELVIEYPVSGIHFNEIQYSSWIKAKPYVDEEDLQLFRVYKITKAINGVCTIYAEHVSYMLSYAVVSPNLTPYHRYAAGAIDAINANVVMPEYKYGGDYYFELTCTWASSTELDFPMQFSKSIREYLLGDEASIVAVYGPAEFKWVNFGVLIYPPGGRGSDSGIKIQYGKNLTNLKMDVSDEEIITGYYPYWSKAYQQSGGLSFDIQDLGRFSLPKIITYQPAVDNFGFYPRIIPLNLADFEKWKNIPAEDWQTLTANDFYECVDDYMRSQGITEFGDTGPTTHARRSVEVSFIDISTTEQYKNIQPLEAIKLGDTVTIEYREFDISEKMRVIKTEYNVLEGAFNQLTLGAEFNALY